MSQSNPKRSRPTGASREHMERLRIEAEERRAVRARRSPADQLALLDKRPGLALRERARLGDDTANEILSEENHH